MSSASHGNVSHEEHWVGLLVTGNGRYGYFAVRADKVEEFRKIIAVDGDVDLPEYVLLLTEGNGRPSEAVLERIEKKTYFSPRFMNALREQATS